MAGRNGQELLGTWVPSDVAARFKTHARSTEGGVSAELRRLVLQAAEGKPTVRLGTSGRKVMVRLKEEERSSLLEAARDRNTTPANWLRSLALAHLSQRPQWNEAEVKALRDVYIELRRIGNNLNQIARALNVAVQTGDYPEGQGHAAKQAAEDISQEVRRVGGLVAANVAYWGLPTSDITTKGKGRGGHPPTRLRQMG